MTGIVDGRDACTHAETGAGAERSKSRRAHLYGRVRRADRVCVPRNHSRARSGFHDATCRRSGDRAGVRRRRPEKLAINFGVWHSLQTGSTGSDGPSEKLHYEEDFYATLGLGFAKSLSLGTTFTAYTSPNGGFNTVKELMFQGSQASRFNPYGRSRSSSRVRPTAAATKAPTWSSAPVRRFR
jgi:hypothetical protein